VSKIEKKKNRKHALFQIHVSVIPTTGDITTGDIVVVDMSQELLGLLLFLRLLLL
jgi:hypothetical protein